jgi:hypothetical protein
MELFFLATITCLVIVTVGSAISKYLRQGEVTMGEVDWWIQ